jgi:hypothetical protein
MPLLVYYLKKRRGRGNCPGAIPGPIIPGAIPGPIPGAIPGPIPGPMPGPIPGPIIPGPPCPNIGLLGKALLCAGETIVGAGGAGGIPPGQQLMC